MRMKTGNTSDEREQSDIVPDLGKVAHIRKSIMFKSLLRSPTKVILTFLFIAAAAFMAVSRTLIYSSTDHETKRLASFYRGVAAVDNGIPYVALGSGSIMPAASNHGLSPDNNSQQIAKSLSQDAMLLFSNLPGVSSTEVRYMTSGIIQGLSRVVEFGGYKPDYYYTDRFVIEGTIVEIEAGKLTATEINTITLSDYKLLGGNLALEHLTGVHLVAFTTGAGVIAMSDADGELYTATTIFDNPYGQEFINDLEIGQRCVAIGRFASPRINIIPIVKGFYTDAPDDPELVAFINGLSEGSLFLGDFDTLDYVDSFHIIDGLPEDYLDFPEFERVKEIVEITNRDLVTFDVVYTGDMLAIPRFNEGKMVIREGRAISPSDSGNIAVISSALAEVNALTIGDTITVELCDRLLMQHYDVGALAVIPERYGEVVKTADLEIVGIYADTDPLHQRRGDRWWAYAPNTIFVPLELLPIQIPRDHEVRPGEFSLVIDDVLLIGEFLDSANPLLNYVGFKSLRFSDGGWQAVEEDIRTGQIISLLTFLLFLAGSVVALLLTLFVYITREKRNYAIMRVLGVPAKRVRNAITLPLAVMSVLAMGIGAAVGGVYASMAIQTAVEALAATTVDKYVPDASLSIPLLACSVAGILLFLFVVVAALFERLARQKVLVLLQEAMRR